MSLPTLGTIHHMTDIAFRIQNPSAPDVLDPNNAEHADYIRAWTEVKAALVTEATDGVFARFYPDAGRLVPSNPAHAEHVENWRDIYNQICDGVPNRIDWNSVQTPDPHDAAHDIPNPSNLIVQNVDSIKLVWPEGGRRLTTEHVDRWLWGSNARLAGMTVEWIVQMGDYEFLVYGWLDAPGATASLCPAATAYLQPFLNDHATWTAIVPEFGLPVWKVLAQHGGLHEIGGEWVLVQSDAGLIEKAPIPTDEWTRRRIEYYVAQGKSLGWAQDQADIDWQVVILVLSQHWSEGVPRRLIPRSASERPHGVAAVLRAPS